MMSAVQGNIVEDTLAMTIVETQITLCRVRQARARLFEKAPSRLPITPAENKAQRQQTLESGAAAAGDNQDSEVDRFIRALPQLLKLDRYEGRALSRRRRALERLGAMAQSRSTPPFGFASGT